MAVQQNKKSPSRRNMRRAHDALKTPALSRESHTGEWHLRHHISPSGYYRGRQVMVPKAVRMSQRKAADHGHDHE